MSEELEDLNALDKKILDGHVENKSPREISDEMGGVMSPERVMQRTAELLDSHDYLDDHRKLQLVVYEMGKAKAMLFKMLENGDIRAAPTLRAILRDLAGVITKSNEKYAEQMMRVYEVHARVMAKAIKVAMLAASLELQNAHPEIPPAEINAAFTNNLPLALESLKEDTGE